MLHVIEGNKFWNNRSSSCSQTRALKVARELYFHAYVRGMLGKMWATLTGRTRHLLNLNEVETTGALQCCYRIGTETVPIRQIRGSQGRCRDFDCDFYPIQNHTNSRWLRVASARQQGIVLPPVELIQVGEIFFVQDGHHRVSVARAMGQEYIEAEVKVWQMSGRQFGEDANIVHRDVALCRPLSS